MSPVIRLEEVLPPGEGNYSLLTVHLQLVNLVWIFSPCIFAVRGWEFGNNLLYMFGKTEERSGDRRNLVVGAEAGHRSELRVGSLFGQRKDLLFSQVNSLAEANFHQCRLSEWVGEKAVERDRNENDDDEEIQPPVHFVRKRSEGQYCQSAHQSEDSVNCASR